MDNIKVIFFDQVNHYEIKIHTLMETWPWEQHREQRIKAEKAKCSQTLILLPFSSEVNPEAASTFSKILLSFITLVAHTYPCLEDKKRKPES